MCGAWWRDTHHVHKDSWELLLFPLDPADVWVPAGNALSHINRHWWQRWLILNPDFKSSRRAAEEERKEATLLSIELSQDTAPTDSHWSCHFLLSFPIHLHLSTSLKLQSYPGVQNCPNKFKMRTLLPGFSAADKKSRKLFSLKLLCVQKPPWSRPCDSCMAKITAFYGVPIADHERGQLPGYWAFLPLTTNGWI